MLEFRLANEAFCLVCLTLLVHVAKCSPPDEPVKCASGTANCTITNSYGAFSDRITCRAAEVVYPASEDELVKAVASAAVRKMKMKAATRYSHSITRLACPGGNGGLLISTRNLSRVLSVNASSLKIVVESGVTLKQLIESAAQFQLALPYTPYWWGLTVGGLLATGAHGSSLRGKGSAVHEYVVGVRIVTPTSSSDGFAKVREIDVGHPDLDAVRVSLGILGVVSQVTLKLEPMFKRSISFVERNDSDIADKAVALGNQHEFADIMWLPGHRMAVYRVDDRVSSNTTGDGYNDYIGFRAVPTAILAINRAAEETWEATNFSDGKCINSKITIRAFAVAGYGLKNKDIFTGYPVIGFQNRLQSSGSCIESKEDALFTACPWDPRVKGEFYHQTTFSIALSKAKDFILDVQKLRDMYPKALCGVELYNGFLMRYVKSSSAFMGKQEDSLDFDITYYRSHDPLLPRMYEDVLEEIEQMGLFKYGALPHWGKNRNLAFEGVIGKYAKAKEFLKVKDEYDPDGLFSSEWSDQILGINGRPSIVKDGCALEGLCICSEDRHCAPAKGYVCRPGKVYVNARVCTRLTRK